MNPQTCTEYVTNRSSRLTASPDVWMCDPLPPPPPPDMPPGVLSGDLYLAYAHSQMNPQTWTKLGAIRPSRLTASPDFLMFDPLKSPKCPLVYIRAICLAYIHSQMNMHMCTKLDANRTSRLTYSSDFWICDPLTPPPPNVEGRIVFSLCPFPDESADVYGIWCQSVQSFDSLPRLLDLWPPKTPRNALLCLEVQLVWHISIPRLICTCVPN